MSVTERSCPQGAVACHTLLRSHCVHTPPGLVESTQSRFRPRHAYGFALEDVTREAIDVVIAAQTRAQGLSYLNYLGVGPSFLAEEDIPVVAALFSLWFPKRVLIAIWDQFGGRSPAGLGDDYLDRLHLGRRNWSQASTESDELFSTVRVQERQWPRFQKRCIAQAADIASDPRST